MRPVPPGLGPRGVQDMFCAMLIGAHTCNARTHLRVVHLTRVAGKLNGMHENMASFPCPDVDGALENAPLRVLRCSNVELISRDAESSVSCSRGDFTDSEQELKFCGVTVTGEQPLLLTVSKGKAEGSLKVRVNTEATVLGMRVLEEVKKSLLAPE
mmetsp:Transcript_36901/g.79840  ORF Transcript_36901/g.79840 Transcript_36901/m.79840 type:complete len:156 (+) Transcript_36901:1662-2129(+)